MTDTALTSPLGAPAAAAAELDAAEPDLRSVIAWLSAHSAALERVVYPAAAANVLNGSGIAARVTREMENALLSLHQVVSGDARRGTALLPAAVSHVRAHLDEHLSALAALTRDLEAAIPVDSWSRLLGWYAEALALAPSRPHPHAPHSGWAQHLAFTVTASVDRVLDALDSRVVARVPEQRASAHALPDLDTAAVG
jgi:hypothetical protein